MKNQSVMFSSQNGEWETPPEVFNPLNDEFHFVLDVCASDLNHKCDEYFTMEDDCFRQSWVREGYFWMNPEYGNPELPCKTPYERCHKKKCVERGYHVDTYQPGIIDFVAKATAETLRGAKGVLLLPARTDTEWWSLIWNHHVHRPRPWIAQLRFLKGRIKFVGAPDVAPFPSVVAVFDNHKPLLSRVTIYGR
jgi:phage N-6-adenine-methyltransferase